MAPEAGMKRLYKSRSDRMIDGICGGLAEYFGLDPTLVRIAMVLLLLCGGLGLVLYIAAMILMPSNPPATSAAASAPPLKTSTNNHRFWGIILVGVGIVWFMGNMGWSFWHHWWWFSWETVIPLLLILAGVMFLFGGRSYISGTAAQAEGGASTPPAGVASTSTRRLYRSRAEKKVFGVCGGIGEYFAIDPVLIRVLFVMAAFVSLGFVLLMYIVMAFVVPQEPAISPAH